MRIDWKVSAISASAAFLLSVLVGIIGNVSFGALLLRAVIGAVLFGAGAIGISVLIDRFLPDLKAAVTPEPAEKIGGKVDIVVEGDDSDVLMSAGNDEGFGEEDAQAVGLNPVPGDGDTSGEFGDDESADELPAVDESGDEAYKSMADDSQGEEIGSEAIEELAAADNLPDVEGFADSFSETPTERASTPDRAGDPANDPAVLAKAIRTVLKRDE